MPDAKITALASIGTGADPANDPLVIVDVSDTTMAASGTTKKLTINQILGASGTATLASATITGDLTVATSALKVTGGKVGIGTVSPAYKLDVSSATASNQLRIFGSNQNSITFGNAAGGASNGFLMGRSFSSDDANNLFVFDLANSALRFFIGDTGNVGIGTASPAFKLDVSGSAGSGIRFTGNSVSTVMGETGGFGLLGTTTNHNLGLYTNGSLKATIDTAGNCGIGVAPSAWGSAFKAVDFGTVGGMAATGVATRFTHNSYNNGTNFIYKASSVAACLYELNAGEHRWFTAPSGTAGNAITFTQAMTLDASGNLGIGPTTPAYKLDTYTTLQGTVTAKQFANRTANKILVKRFFGITADTALFSVECGTAGAGAMAAFEINVFATGQKSGSSGDRQFYGKWYVTRNLAGTFTITSAFSSGSSGAFTVAASGTSLNVNGIFSVISDGSACVEVTGYIGGRDTVAETALTVTMP